MNIHHLFSAFLSLFFLGKSTASIREKVRRASGIRTFAYFVLAFIVGVFFYKTYQVKTISNGIDINPLVGAYDSLGVCGDTIHKLNIFHKLDDGGIYQSFKIPDDGDSRNHQRKGGYYAEIWSPIEAPFALKNNPHLSGSALKMYNDSLHLERFKTCYSIATTNIQPPSLFPFSLIELADSVITDAGWEMRFQYFPIRVLPSEAFNMKNEEMPQDYFNNGSVALSTIGILNDFPILDDYKYLITKFQSKSSEINRYNIFTAADISQFSYVLSVNSPIVIDRILVDFDQPIEILDNDSCIKVNPSSFVVRGSLVDSLRSQKDVLMCHVKLPTNSNLQLIRSLFITTLLTALLALFFNNLYYVLRKIAQDYYNRHKLPVKILRKLSRKRVKRYRKMKSILSIICLSLLAASFVLVACDSPVLLIINLIWIPIMILVSCFGIITYVLYRGYKYAVSPVGRDKKGKKHR